MIIIANLMIAVGTILRGGIWIFYWLLIAHVILSWVSPDPRNPIVAFIYNTTEPILSRIRPKIPPMGFLDLSPLIVLALLYFVDLAVAQSLLDYAYKLKF